MYVISNYFMRIHSRTILTFVSIMHELNKPQVIDIYRMTARSDLNGPTHAPKCHE